MIAEDALGVVGNDHNVGVCDRVARRLDDIGFNFLLVSPRGFPVDPEKLLPAAHDASLADRRPGAVNHEMR